MDDDPFSQSVWDIGSPSSSKAPLELPKPSIHETSFAIPPPRPPTADFQLDFDDAFSANEVEPPTFSSSKANNNTFGVFDDFDEPLSAGLHANGLVSPGADDDFGDFGDFGEADESGLVVETVDDFRIPPSPRKLLISDDDWTPLDLDPVPSLRELEELVQDLLRPIWSDVDISGSMIDEPLREAHGLGRILVTPESRELYNILLNSAPPSFRPPNWIRSRIRRQHLISLGIPINLDEVNPQANGKKMPALEITTRPASAPPGPVVKASPKGHSHTMSGVPSRSGSPRPGTPSGPFAAVPSPMTLPPKPDLDQAKVDAVLALDPDSLALLPLGILEGHMAKLQEVMKETNALLTHLLQTRETLQQNSETYNELIGEMVSEATRKKTGKGRPSSSSRRG